MIVARGPGGGSVRSGIGLAIDLFTIPVSVLAPR